MNRFISLLLCPFLLSFLAISGECADTVIYVSLSGSDSWSGKKAVPDKDMKDGPFATLERAKQEVKKIKNVQSNDKSKITVLIKTGFYSIKDTFRLGAEDSGTDSAPVVWSAFPGEEVHFIGGRIIKGFKPATGSDIIGRLTPEAAGKVLVTDLKAQKITDYGSIKNKGWAKGSLGMELFFNGAPMIIARYPNESPEEAVRWLKIADVPQAGDKLLNPGLERDKRYDGVPAGRNYGKIKYDGNRPEKWKQSDDIWMHGYWTWDWADTYQHVKKIDTATKEVYIDDPQCEYGYTKNQRYCFLNIFEELDSPGEWYLDRQAGKLYFWPPSPIEKGEAFVSMLDSLMISVKDASYISIENIIFEGSRGSAVKISGGTGNIIAGCKIRNMGNDAIIIDGGTNNGVVSCDIYNVENGISLSGGDRKTLTPGGNYAVNNDIHNYSRINKTLRPAILINGVGNRIAHNLIHDAPHMGVLFNGNENILEYNEVHDIALETGDVGAFYIGRDWTQRGNIVRYNYFHNLLGPGLYGVMAVYLDDWSSATTIYGNIFYKAGRAAFVGGGRDNTIENNVFIECAPSTHVDARGLSWAKYYFDKTLPDYTNTMFDRMDAMNYLKPPFSEKYPELLKLYSDNPDVPKNNRIIRNVSYGGIFASVIDGMDFKIIEFKDNLIADPVICKWQKKLGGEEAEYKNGDPEIAKNLAGNVIITCDPGFVSLEKKDFRLKDDSPAWKLGFKKIPVEKIGLETDEYRKTLPGKR